MRIPEIVKLTFALLPSLPGLRIVEILGIDIQGDSETHMGNLGRLASV